MDEKMNNTLFQWTRDENNQGPGAKCPLLWLRDPYIHIHISYTFTTKGLRAPDLQVIYIKAPHLQVIYLQVIYLQVIYLQVIYTSPQYHGYYVSKCEIT
jgi:hypothetical protein